MDKFEITNSDGLRLRGETFGKRVAGSFPVLCVPGLTRNSRDFHPLANWLANNPDRPRFVITLNLRGHGASDYASNPNHYDLLHTAKDVIESVTALGFQKADFIGSSLGGLFVMAIASLQPRIIRACILNDIGPVIDTTGLSRMKTYLPRLQTVQSWKDAKDYCKAIYAGQFTAFRQEEWEQLAHMTFREEKSKPIPDFDQNLTRNFELLNLSKGMPDFWPYFAALSPHPLMIVHGENSDMLSAQTVREMANRHPDCQVCEVSDQGHAPFFLDKTLNERITSFLNNCDKTG